MKTIISALGWVGLVLVLCFFAALLQEVVFGNYLRKNEHREWKKKNGLFFALFIMILIMSGQAYAEDATHLEYKRADGSSEYYGDANGNRITREAYIELGKASIQSMQNQVVAFGQNDNAAINAYQEQSGISDDQAKSMKHTQQQGQVEAVQGLEKSKQEFVKSIEAHKSVPTFSKPLVSLERKEQ